MLAGLGSGCNAVALRERSLSRKLERHELRRERLALGDGLHVAFWHGGTGPTVLLVHGFGAAGSWQWHHQVPMLVEAGYSPLIPDLLWFGDSIDEQRRFGVERQAEAMRRLLDALALDSVDVTGLSYGGMVAHALALVQPRRIRSLVLVSSPAQAWAPTDQVELLRSHRVESMAELLLPNDAEGVSRLFGIAYASPPRVPRLVRGQVVEHFYRHHRDERVALLSSIPADMTELRSIGTPPQLPTLIVWGREDEVFPLPAAERLAAEVGARGRLVVLDQAGHAPQLEQPQAFNQAMLGFLREVGSNG